nr:hypothetical protein [Tanacetum cinerariifolium]
VEEHQPGGSSGRADRHHRPQWLGQKLAGQAVGRPVSAGRGLAVGRRRRHSPDRRQRTAPQHRIRPSGHPVAVGHAARQPD